MCKIDMNIPKNTLKIFTDGSKIADHAGSGICIEAPPPSRKKKDSYNPDYCSVFRREITAINETLG